MADNLRFPFSGRVILDANGDPVSGAKLEVFDAGTEDAHNVYTNAALTVAAANPIVANSNGVVPQRFLGTGDWKVTFKDSSDVTLSNYDTLDDEPGALDTSSFLTGTVAPSRASESATSATTMTSAERGKQINCDATGGDFTYTLEAATAGGDGTDIVIKNTGEIGTVTVAQGGSQDDILLPPLNSVTVRSDGAAWQGVEAYSATNSVSTVTYAASVALDLAHPSGTLYQITCTGDLTLANPTSQRIGTFFQVAIVQDATGGRDVTFGSDFVTEPWIDISASATTILGCFIRGANTIEAWPLTGRDREWDYVAYNEQAQNTNGGTVTSGSSATSTLNSADTDVYSLGDPSSNEVTLPPGKWEIEWYHPFNSCNVSQSWLYDVTGAAVLEYGTCVSASSGAESTATSIGHTVQTFSAANAVRIEHQVTTTRANDGQGNAANFATERYLMFRARKLASI